eukprot:12359013-Karenia_brevis.AAC.1
MPHHAWMLDEMHKSLCMKLDLPSAEGLHMAHTIMEKATGFVGGTTGRVRARDMGWQRHVLRSPDENVAQ